MAPKTCGNNKPKNMPMPNCPCNPSDCIACPAKKSHNEEKLKFKEYFHKVIVPTVLKRIEPILADSSLTPTQQKLYKIAVRNSIIDVAPIVYCQFYDIAISLPSEKQLVFFTGLILNLRANILTTVVEYKLKLIYDEPCVTLKIKEDIVSTWMVEINAYAKKHLFFNPTNCK
jgi:hypothetical protein